MFYLLFIIIFIIIFKCWKEFENYSTLVDNKNKQDSTQNKYENPIKKKCMEP